MSANCPLIPHTWTAGDTLPEIVMTLDDTDLTGYTVDLLLRRPDGSLLTKLATFIDAAQGKFKFSWASTDLQEGISQQASVKFIIGGDVEHTEHLRIDVQGAP